MRESLKMTKEEATRNLHLYLGTSDPAKVLEISAGRLPRPKVYSYHVKTSRTGLQRTYRFLAFLPGGSPVYLSRSIAALLGLHFVSDNHGDGIRGSYLDPLDVVAELSEKLYGDSKRTPDRSKVLEHVSL